MDWDVDKPGAPLSTIISILPLTMAILASKKGILGQIIYWPIATALSLTFFSFMVWRAYKLAAIGGRSGDDLYDQKTKYLLPPEYADTMSATKARRLRRQKRTR